MLLTFDIYSTKVIKKNVHSGINFVFLHSVTFRSCFKLYRHVFYRAETKILEHIKNSETYGLLFVI